MAIVTERGQFNASSQKKFKFQPVVLKLDSKDMNDSGTEVRCLGFFKINLDDNGNG